MNFRITGLKPGLFAHLSCLSDEALAGHRARRVIADAKPGFPDRIGLRDAEVGESLILVNHTHQDADTPYRASHAVFIAEASDTAYDTVGEVPDCLFRRTVSLRVFTAGGDMAGAELAAGAEIEPAILRLLADPRAAYIHAHNAAPGCYAARIERA